MTLHFQVLGKPGRDNALFVRVESGQSTARLLFDCGDGCLSSLPFSEIQAIDHLCFSHLHMDHIGGFDSFFRCTFNRDVKPNVIWGPAGTSAILHHRFQGFWWNLHANQSGTWSVNDVHPTHIERFRYEISEAFSERHNEGKTDQSSLLLDTSDYSVSAIHLKHNGPCLGYVVCEKPKWNIQTDRVAAMGLRPGSWMKDLKSDTATPTIDIEGQTFDLAALRNDLLVESPGESIAYLTDFLLDEATSEQLQEVLGDCTTVVCEAQYRAQDIDLAQRNFHTTTTAVSYLAARSGFGNLVLFHLSDRYSREEWGEMLTECRTIFPNTEFPKDWNIEPNSNGS